MGSPWFVVVVFLIGGEERTQIVGPAVVIGRRRQQPEVQVRRLSGAIRLSVRERLGRYEATLRLLLVLVLVLVGLVGILVALAAFVIVLVVLIVFFVFVVLVVAAGSREAGVGLVLAVGRASGTAPRGHRAPSSASPQGDDGLDAAVGRKVDGHGDEGLLGRDLVGVMEGSQWMDRCAGGRVDGSWLWNSIASAASLGAGHFPFDAGSLLAFPGSYASPVT